MFEYQNLKDSYIRAIRFGLAADFGYNRVYEGKEVICEFCKMLVDNSDYSEADKSAMKCELDLIKEMLSREIKIRYNK